jgi:hypothetical protein
MGEAEARALARPGRTIAIDEPYPHYQFAGRADVLAWEDRDLLHIENRTQFPNLQDAAGSYNAKRQYLARSLAEGLDIGPRGEALGRGRLVPERLADQDEPARLERRSTPTPPLPNHSAQRQGSSPFPQAMSSWRVPGPTRAISPRSRNCDSTRGFRMR